MSILKKSRDFKSHRGDLRVLLHGRSSEPNSFAYELSHVGGCECLSIMGGPDTRLMAATYKICLWVHDRWLPFFYCWSPLVGFGFHLSSNSLIRPRLAHQSQCYWAKSVEMPRYGQRQRNFKSTIGRTHNWCKRCRLLPKKNSTSRRLVATHRADRNEQQTATSALRFATRVKTRPSSNKSHSACTTAFIASPAGNHPHHSSTLQLLGHLLQVKIGKKFGEKTSVAPHIPSIDSYMAHLHKNVQVKTQRHTQRSSQYLCTHPTLKRFSTETSLVHCILTRLICR